MPTAVFDLLDAIARAAATPRPDPLQDAIRAARRARIGWTAITAAVNASAVEPRTVSAIWARYSWSADHNREAARERSRRRSGYKELPGLSISEAAQQLGIAVTTARKRVNALFADSPAVTTAYRGTVRVTRVLDIEALRA